MNKESQLGEELLFKWGKIENRPNFKIKLYLKPWSASSLG